MAFLYVSTKGVGWQKHSYTAGCDYDQSAYKYYLRRVLGWKTKMNRAAFLFGKAIEEAIQYHHDHSGEGAVDYFNRKWSECKDRLDIKYTKVEKDWETLYLDGQEMVRLYIVRQPELPIPLGGGSVFQREYSKEVFPGDENYDDITDIGKLDIVCYVDPAHPALAKVDKKFDVYRPLIVDIKTSSINFPEINGMAAFDAQLRRYSWLTGIQDVALLWFKKTNRTLQKGSDVSLLEPAEPYKAGEEVVIAECLGENIRIVKNESVIKFDKGIVVPASFLTKQKLQFNTGFVSEKSANDAGLLAGRQIVQIVNSWKTGEWPNTFGIRYPHDDTNDPYFRAFVLGDESYKVENFEKIDEDFFADEADNED